MWTHPDASTPPSLLHAKLTIRVAHRLPLASAAEAHRLLERRGTRGAVVLT
jgi:NADPH:quinone reductase-like Zn-dependent oxidoreductase